MSKEPIDLMPVNIDQIVVSDKFNNNNNNNNNNNDSFRYLLVTKKVKLLSHYVLFYLKWVGI